MFVLSDPSTVYFTTSYFNLEQYIDIFTGKVKFIWTIYWNGYGSDSGSAGPGCRFGSGKMMPIRPYSDPQYCLVSLYSLEPDLDLDELLRHNGSGSAYNLKVWWPYATLFVFIFIYTIDYLYIQTSFIHNMRWGPSPYLHSCRLSGAEPPWGAELRFELGPALQQASALPTEPPFFSRVSQG